MEQLQENETLSQLPKNIPDTSGGYFSRFRSRKEPLLFAIIFFISILIIGFYIRSTATDVAQTTTDTKSNKFISDNIIVYGYWDTENAIVALKDLSNNTEGVLARLPSNVKHVKITSPTTIAFISDTDERDHGKNIVERNLSTGKDTIIYSSEAEFGIDDFAISDGGQYLSVWEIKPSQGSGVLLNGESRVYNYDTNSSKKYLIFNETFSPGDPVHYPIGITKSGELFTDRFVANSGAGWAYGMSKSNLDGTEKIEIPTMKNGSYSSQPVMSSDGRFIAFAGFVGVDGEKEVDGIRTAVKNPNTVDLLDTQTLEREIIGPLQENILYPNISWDLATNNLFFVKLNTGGSKSNILQLAYNPTSKVSTEITNTDNLSDNSGIAYSTLGNNSYLMGKKEASGDFMGNLGGKYSRAIKSMAYLENVASIPTPIDFTHYPLQLISIVKRSYFSDDLLTTSLQQAKNQLQLQTFAIKQELEPKRKIQQSYPPPPEQPNIPDVPVVDQPSDCVDGGSYQTAKQCYGDKCGNFLLEQCNGDPACETYAKENYISNDGTCTDSPLYMYGNYGQKVKVSIGVPLYSPNISYSPQEGVNVVIASDDKFYANGKLISGFSFDYLPGIKKIQRPTYGLITSRKQLPLILEEYASKLGLNQKEKDDLIVATSSVKANKLFVSFFDHKTSHKILPIYFDPIPNVYRNIVFYIESIDGKPAFKYQEPSFEKIERSGLSAIEISVMRKD